VSWAWVLAPAPKKSKRKAATWQLKLGLFYAHSIPLLLPFDAVSGSLRNQAYINQFIDSGRSIKPESILLDRRNSRSHRVIKLFASLVPT